jgi:hypothetical protein
MAHKGGSGSGGFVRPTNFTKAEAEARVLSKHAILVPVAWHLPHGWNVSAAGYAVPPLPEGAELKTLIGRRWQMLPMHELDLPENVTAAGAADRARRFRRALRRQVQRRRPTRLVAEPGRRRRASGVRLRAAPDAPPSYQRTVGADATEFVELVLGRGILWRVPRHSPRPTHHQRGAAPASSSGMSWGLPAA